MPLLKTGYLVPKYLLGRVNSVLLVCQNPSDNHIPAALCSRRQGLRYSAGAEGIPAARKPVNAATRGPLRRRTKP